MKTNSVPAVIMLTAGLIDCIVSIYQRLSLFDFTKQLLITIAFCMSAILIMAETERFLAQILSTIIQILIL